MAEKKDVRRTIERVFFPKADRIWDVDDLFRKYPESERFKLRFGIEQGIQSGNPECTCPSCGQPLKLVCAGNRTRSLHFQHVRNSGFCADKSHKSPGSKKKLQAAQFNGLQEGREHREAKELIKTLVEKNKDVQNVELEKRLSDCTQPRQWRRPDVYLEFRDKKVAIEVQLVPIFLSTIVSREKYYQDNSISLLWVLDSFSSDKDLQTFTHKDICYRHRHNVFCV
jgi:competence CoiA-like predicted nuclease